MARVQTIYPMYRHYLLSHDICSYSWISTDTEENYIVRTSCGQDKRHIAISWDLVTVETPNLWLPRDLIFGIYVLYVIWYYKWDGSFRALSWKFEDTNAVTRMVLLLLYALLEKTRHVPNITHKFWECYNLLC